MRRLRRLGLTRQDIAEIYRRWDAMDGDERIEALAAMDALEDDDLRDHLVEMRAELAGG